MKPSTSQPELMPWTPTTNHASAEACRLHGLELAPAMSRSLPSLARPSTIGSSTFSSTMTWGRPPSRAIEVPSAISDVSLRASSAVQKVRTARPGVAPGHKLPCVPKGHTWFLSGVTAGAKEHNELIEQELGGEQLVETRPRLSRSTIISVDRDDEQHFVRTSDQLVSRIADIRRKHDAYEGKPGIGGDLAGGKRRNSEVDYEEQLTLERRAERMEAYKFLRKLEPELPPLQPYRAPFPSKGAVDQGIIMRHTSDEFLRSMKPELRETARQQRMEKMQERREVAASRRVSVLDEYQRSVCDDLARKSKQAERAVASRRQMKKRSSNEDERYCAENWMTIAVACRFADTLSERLHMRKLARVPKMTRSSTLMLIFGPGSAPSEESLKMQANFSVVVARFRLQRLLKMQRKKARLVHQCLSASRFAGRFFLCMGKVVRTVKHIQSWWRSCRIRLRKIRDRLSKRWARLEYSELARELGGDTWKPSNSLRKQQLSLMPLEDKIAMETISEDARLTFLEHEMRARRYFVLSAVHVWEDEVRRWRTLKSQVPMRRRHSTAEFNVPTERPSYVPPDHPRHDRGFHCSDTCCGRRGDQEILAMWRAAREHRGGGGWREIPKIGASAKKEGKAGDQDAAEQVARPFGEPAADELARWGVDVALMPGLAPREGPQLVEPGFPL